MQLPLPYRQRPPIVVVAVGCSTLPAVLVLADRPLTCPLLTGRSYRGRANDLLPNY